VPGSSRVILLGVDSSLAESVLRQIEERDLDIGRLHAVSPADVEVERSFRGEMLGLDALEDFVWQAGDRVLVTGRSAWVSRQFDAIRAGGGEVVALGAVAGAEAYARAAGRFISSLGANGGIEWVSLTAFLPVSLAGQSGVDELASQTRSLFAMEDVEPETFPMRIAFNLIPEARALGEDGSAAFERALAASVRAAHGGCDAQASAVWCPVFYGGAISLQVRLGRRLDLAALRARIGETAGLTLFDVDLPGGVPTPASDAQDSDNVFVGRVRRMDERTCGAWLVFDIDRIEATALVDALEIMIEKKAI